MLEDHADHARIGDHRQHPRHFAAARTLAFLWDINTRESTVLGLVGASGIGLQFDSLISSLAWAQVSPTLLVILATVIVSEWVSAKIRHGII